MAQLQLKAAVLLSCWHGARPLKQLALEALRVHPPDQQVLLVLEEATWESERQ